MTGAGRLDRSIIILRSSSARDGFNNEVVTWHPLAKRRASYRPSTANERIASQENAASVEAIFEIRWSSTVADINPKDRLQYNARDFDIIEATEIGRREGIRIKATARAD